MRLPLKLAEGSRAWADEWEKRQAALKLVEAREKEVKLLEAQVEDMQEDVTAHARLTKAEGSLTLTEVAKTFGIRTKALTFRIEHNASVV